MPDGSGNWIFTADDGRRNLSRGRVTTHKKGDGWIALVEKMLEAIKEIEDGKTDTTES